LILPRLLAKVETAVQRLHPKFIVFFLSGEDLLVSRFSHKKWLKMILQFSSISLNWSFNEAESETMKVALRKSC